jgi:hypothetical protein
MSDEELIKLSLSAAPEAIADFHQSMEKSRHVRCRAEQWAELFKLKRFSLTTFASRISWAADANVNSAALGPR